MEGKKRKSDLPVPLVRELRGGGGGLGRAELVSPRGSEPLLVAKKKEKGKRLSLYGLPRGKGGGSGKVVFQAQKAANADATLARGGRKGGALRSSLMNCTKKKEPVPASLLRSSAAGKIHFLLNPIDLQTRGE